MLFLVVADVLVIERLSVRCHIQDMVGVDHGLWRGLVFKIG